MKLDEGIFWLFDVSVAVEDAFSDSGVRANGIRGLTPLKKKITRRDEGKMRLS